jgi:Gpi18-like mannosyltransferase
VLVGVLAVFVGVTVVLTAVVASCGGPAGSGVPRPVTVPGWLAGWCQWDGRWYLRIAESGYFYTPGRQSSVAFFPAFPMLLRGVAAVVGDVRVGGWLLSVLAGALAVVLFAGWVRTRLPRPAALTAVAVLVVYPYAFFLHGAVYSDGLFLATAIGAFVLLERRMYWLAGVVGAVATAGRPVGVAVAVGLVVRLLEIRAEARTPPMTAGGVAGSAAGGPGAAGEPSGGAGGVSPRLR